MVLTVILYSLCFVPGKEHLKPIIPIAGSIIRCMRRLEEALRQMVQAAKAIGNTELENKFAEGLYTSTEPCLTLLKIILSSMSQKGSNGLARPLLRTSDPRLLAGITINCVQKMVAGGEPCIDSEAGTSNLWQEAHWKYTFQEWGDVASDEPKLMKIGGRKAD